MAKMKAVVVSAFGSADKLLYIDTAEPRLQSGEVLIRIEATGVGQVDIMAREGRYRFQTPGFIPGLEIAGEVCQLGPGADPEWLGRRVLALPSEGGGYAERIAIKVEDLIPLPDEVSSREAVALGMNALVAAAALERAHPGAEERILVRGAGGGIGIMLTQLSARATDSVTATTSSRERGQRLSDLGASAIWNRNVDPELPSDNFDVILDTVLGPETLIYISKLRNNGRYVMCGGVGGPPSSDYGTGLLTNFHKSPSLFALSLNSFRSDALKHLAANVFDSFRKGQLSAVFDSDIPLSQAAEAHKRLETGEPFGKILLIPTDRR
ncbi:zinc-binding dehydrogenase [Telmatobacter bradus]|uniref:zinc-binding dehydrogenase n=1 Tax=Telmatobacter bradus TaxID=474953 RepID=UPI003B436A9A